MDCLVRIATTSYHHLLHYRNSIFYCIINLLLHKIPAEAKICYTKECTYQCFDKIPYVDSKYGLQT